MIKDITCICCPVGCIIHTERKENEIIVSGHNCTRGERYAKEELISPKRMITSTVKVIDGDRERLPVKTSGPIDKDRIFSCMKVVHDIKINAPVGMGDVVVKDIIDGIDLISCGIVRNGNNEEENF